MAEWAGWPDADAALFFKHIALPQPYLCEKLPHAPVSGLRDLFEGMHRFHESRDISAVPDVFRARLAKTKKDSSALFASTGSEAPRGR